MSGRVPRVSLGMPVYNGESYLAEALDSVLSQSFGDFELFISDNASTDGTEQLAHKYAGRDPRIRYSRNASNLGVSANFGRVFEETSGPYFKWVVHDDVLEPGYLAACVSLLDRAGDVAALAYPKTLLIDERGAVLGPYEDRMDLRDARPSQRFARLLRDLKYAHCGLGLIRREALRQTDLIGPFERSDVVMLGQLALRWQFWEHPERLYRRRVHAQSSMVAYTTPEEYAARMGRRVRVAMPRWTLLAEMARSVMRAPLGMRERLRCQGVLLGEWGSRYWRQVLGEWKRLALYPLSGAGRTARGG